MAQEEGTGGLLGYIRDSIRQLSDWMRPEAQDGLVLRIVKFILKCLVLLLLLAFSPIILIILVLVFFAAF